MNTQEQQVRSTLQQAFLDQVSTLPDRPSTIFDRVNVSRSTQFVYIIARLDPACFVAITSLALDKFREQLAQHWGDPNLTPVVLYGKDGLEVSIVVRLGAALDKPMETR